MLAQARQLDEARRQAGFDQDALDQVAKQGLGNGAFEDGEEDGGAVVEEFFSTPPETDSPATSLMQGVAHHTTLGQKLEAKAEALTAS